MDNLQTMNSRPLEYFLRVAELGSINRAAAELMISQPSLSRQIAALEHELGAELFYRFPSGVKLTDAGKLLADRARPILRQLTELKEQVGEEAVGQVSIGIPPSWQAVFTLDFIDEFSRQHPAVKLRIHEGVSNSLKEQMFSGLLDLAIIPFDPIQADGYKQTLLVRESLVLVGGRESQLSPMRPISVTALDGMRLILPSRPNMLRKHIESALDRRRLGIQVPIEANTVSLCINLAKQNVGFSVTPSCAIHGYPTDGDVRWAPLRGLYLTWVLSENISRSHTQAVRAGQRLALSQIEKVLGEGTWQSAERPQRRSTQ